MRDQVIRVEPAGDPRWDDFILGHPEGRICGTSSWLAVLQEAYGYEPVPLAYEVDGRIEGVLPLCLIRSALTGRRLVSLPFSGPAGPIGSSTEAVARLVEAAGRAMVELRCRSLNIRSGSETAAAALGAFTRVQPFVSSLVTLDADPGTVWRRIPRRTLRGEIRNGWRRGVSVRMGESASDLAAFYRLLTETSRKHGIPPPPQELFRAIWARLRPRGMAHLFVVTVGERVVTAQLCFAFGDVVSAAYVGTDYRFLGHHPVKVVDWATIEWACRQGYRVFDFLQSHVDNWGLRWYKRSFGARERPVDYYYHPRTDGVASVREVLIGRRSPVSGVIKAAVRRLPSRGLQLLGELAYRHVG